MSSVPTVTDPFSPVRLLLLDTNGRLGRSVRARSVIRSDCMIPLAIESSDVVRRLPQRQHATRPSHIVTHARRDLVG